MIEFGKQLKQLRRERGVSQKFIAEQLGISRQAVSKWESDTAQPDLDNLVKLSEVLEVSVDTLVGRASTETTVNFNEQKSADSNASDKRPIVCVLIAALFIFIPYMITIVRPELRVANDCRIMNLWELQFWLESGLLPFLLLTAGSMILGAYFYFKNEK